MGKQNRSLKPHERERHILDLLRRGEFLSLTEIQERLEDHLGIRFERKTIERDVITMSASKNYGLVDDGAHPRRYGLSREPDSALHEVRLNEEHLQTLSMALTALAGFTSMQGLALEAEKAIVKALPDDLKKKMIDQRRSWVLQHPAGGRKQDKSPEKLKTILKALRSNTAVSGAYGIQPEERAIGPVKVEITGNGFSVLARDLRSEKKEIKRFLPARFQSIRSLKQPVALPEIKELKPFWATFAGWGGPAQKPEKLRLIVGESVGEHLREVEYHPTQKVKPLGENRFEVKMELPIGWPIIRLVSSFGGDVFEITPKKLRDEVTAIWSKGLKGLS